MVINPIHGGLSAKLGPSESDPSGGEKFAAAVTNMLKEVNRDQMNAASTMKELVVDGRGTIFEAMSAMSKAEASLRLLMEMRNRMVDGVNKLLQTQV